MPKDDFAPSGSIPTNPEFAETGLSSQTGQLPGGGSDADDSSAGGGNTDDKGDKGDNSASAQSTDGDKGGAADDSAGGDKGGNGDKPETIEELRARIDEQQRFIGKQSTEIGDLRAKIEKINGSTKSTKEEETPPDVTSDLQATLKKFETGEATIEDVVMQSFNAGKSVAEQIVTDKLSQRDREAAVRQQQDSYLSANPDFVEHFQSGKIGDILAQNPLLNGNPVAAHQMLKAQNAQMQISQLQQQVEALTKERETSISAGRNKTGQVISTPGSGTRVNIDPNDPKALRDFMIQGVRAAREQG